MRTSNKVLAGLGAVIIVGLILLIAVFRGFAGRVMKEKPEGTLISGSGNRRERSYDIGGFSEIESSGDWEIKIVEGSEYAVRILAPENMFEVLRIDKEGDDLVLGVRPGYNLEHARLTAEIVMPRLEAVSASGGISCRFSGFSGDRLDIEVSGGADIRGFGGRYENIGIDISGAANVDLGDIETVNADVNLSGAGNIELTMDGGELTGGISGAANLTYYGRVSRLEVEKSGLASISHE